MSNLADLPGVPIEFKRNAREALGDGQLRRNFRGAMDFLMAKRLAQFPDADELERLRAFGNRVRARALSKLPDLLERLEANLTHNGVKVHWAETVEEANAIVHSIVQAHEAKKVIKGKSMVSEEMEMNHFLGDRGVDCLESDMGEFIVQLREEKPSHIIMPAIHLNAGQVASLFHDKLEVDYTEDVDRLIQIGRETLRRKFFEADIGVSGVNFAIAETGTLLLVENEGNGRMSTTVPPVHIAVTGIEKVVENLRDVIPLLSLLTRSATGQPITTYVNMISGPRKADELDGPREVHLVLLDNGRSQAFADGELRQTLNCIRCGACMNHCPVYTAHRWSRLRHCLSRPDRQDRHAAHAGPGQDSATCRPLRRCVAPVARYARSRFRFPPCCAGCGGGGTRARRRAASHARAGGQVFGKGKDDLEGVEGGEHLARPVSRCPFCRHPPARADAFQHRPLDRTPCAAEAGRAQPARTRARPPGRRMNERQGTHPRQAARQPRGHESGCRRLR